MIGSALRSLVTTKQVRALLYKQMLWGLSQDFLSKENESVWLASVVALNQFVSSKKSTIASVFGHPVSRLAFQQVTKTYSKTHWKTEDSNAFFHFFFFRLHNFCNLLILSSSSGKCFLLQEPLKRIIHNPVFFIFEGKKFKQQERLNLELVSADLWACFPPSHRIIPYSTVNGWGIEFIPGHHRS